MNSVIAVLGGLGLFLFGMKVMSESLQNATGERLRNVLWKATNNRVKGVVTGFFITSIIQSSSATTVMVISFVSAGIISLTQSIGIILGANIGTTITGWLVAIIGFKVKIKLLALPAIFIGFFIRFLKNDRATVWGEVLIGFGLLFLGLNFMSDSVKDLRGSQMILDFMSTYKADTPLSTIAVIGVGTVVTMIVQSSSATMAMTMTLAFNGFIDFYTACALVLGENIGTTITANLASINSSVSAKRAARVHMIFNVMGVVWVFLLFKPVFVPLVDYIVPGDVTTTIDGSKSLIADHLAAFHSLFNIINTLVFLPFVSLLGKLSGYLVQGAGTDKEEHHIQFISTTLLATPSMNINQARLEIRNMLELAITMFDSVVELIKSPHRKMKDQVREISSMENNIDLMEKEISSFLVKVAQSSITEEQSQNITGMLHMVNDLERIGDHCESLLKLARRRYELKEEFSPQAMKQVQEISGFVRNAMMNIYGNFDFTNEYKLLSIAENFENEIDRLRKKMKKEHISGLNNGTCDVDTGLIFIDMLNNFERIGDHIFNIAQTISGKRIN